MRIGQCRHSLTASPTFAFLAFAEHEQGESIWFLILLEPLCILALLVQLQKSGSPSRGGEITMLEADPLGGGGIQCLRGPGVISLLHIYSFNKYLLSAN